MKQNKKRGRGKEAVEGEGEKRGGEGEKGGRAYITNKAKNFLSDGKLFP